MLISVVGLTILFAIFSILISINPNPTPASIKIAERCFDLSEIDFGAIVGLLGGKCF